MIAPLPVQNSPHPLVLLVEDEVLARMTLQNMLESTGFRVVPVANADEALEVLESAHDVGIVVTDVKLSSSGMDGLELARKIQREWPIPVLMVSGRAAPNEDELLTGMHFVAKPVHRATLVRLIQGAMEQGTPEAALLAAGRTGVGSQPMQDPRVPPSRTLPGRDTKLTPRQWEVLELLAQGKSNRDIALALELSENTVKVHLAAIFRALGVSSRTEAAIKGTRLLQAQQ